MIFYIAPTLKIIICHYVHIFIDFLKLLACLFGVYWFNPKYKQPIHNVKLNPIMTRPIKVYSVGRDVQE